MSPAASYRIYDNRPWRERVRAWLKGYNPPEEREFLKANESAIRRWVRHPDSGMRMVVNIPADALLAFLREGRYRNAYDAPIVAGVRRGPSPQRRRVDQLVGLDPPQEFFFGAVALGGTGVRFYGEYCMTLKPDAVSADTRVLDRNSYDLLQPPFSTRNQARIAQSLRGQWGQDVVDMLVLKVLPELRNTTRLITLGSVSDSALHDEDFVEVHRQGTFQPSDVEEVRETPEDQAIEAHVLSRIREGVVPRLEELVWVRRRKLVDAALRQAGIRSRVVASSGRGGRWD